jgi:hypothetical protein
MHTCSRQIILRYYEVLLQDDIIYWNKASLSKNMVDRDY